MADIVGTGHHDLLTVPKHFNGSVYGGAGDDVIVVYGDVDILPVYTGSEHGYNHGLPQFSGAWSANGGYLDIAPITVFGGTGRNTVILSGSGIVVDVAAAGHDLIVQNGTGGSIIHAGQGDTVLGQSHAQQVSAGGVNSGLPSGGFVFPQVSDEVQLTGNAQFRGGSANDFVTASGIFAGRVSGGGGNDTLVGGTYAEGGAGDDYLFAERLHATLVGGSGDDIINIRYDQHGNGGAGADAFIFSSAYHVVIEDFVVGEDSARIDFGYVDGGNPPPANVVDLVGHIEVRQTNAGNTVILGDGTVFAVFDGTVGIDVGLRNLISGQVTTLDGTLATIGQFDLVISYEFFP